MALGVPVVASAIGGLPELIGADERGLLIEKPDPALLCNAISRLLGDAALRTRLIAAASEFAKKNNAAAMAGHYLRFYQAIITQERNDFSWLGTGYENEW
jgi:glycosyltransferase involved in cell wall biosynthesis